MTSQFNFIFRRKSHKYLINFLQVPTLLWNWFIWHIYWTYILSTPKSPLCGVILLFSSVIDWNRLAQEEILPSFFQYFQYKLKFLALRNFQTCSDIIKWAIWDLGKDTPWWWLPYLPFQFLYLCDIQLPTWGRTWTHVITYTIFVFLFRSW